MQAPNLSVEAIEQSSSVVYLVNDNLEITHCNAAWDEFALNNGGENWTRDKVVGYGVSRCVPSALQPFYDRMFAKARSGEVVEFEYHCSSPEQFRLLQMRILPVPEPKGFAVVNSLHVVNRHARQSEVSAAELDVYFSKNGLATMCSHCRRVRLQHEWHWVPILLRSKELNISHGLCPVCHEYFYGAYLHPPPPDPTTSG